MSRSGVRFPSPALFPGQSAYFDFPAAHEWLFETPSPDYFWHTPQAVTAQRVKSGFGELATELDLGKPTHEQRDLGPRKNPGCLDAGEQLAAFLEVMRRRRSARLNCNRVTRSKR